VDGFRPVIVPMWCCWQYFALPESVKLTCATSETTLTRLSGCVPKWIDSVVEKVGVVEN